MHGPTLCHKPPPTLSEHTTNLHSLEVFLPRPQILCHNGIPLPPRQGNNAILSLPRSSAKAYASVPHDLPLSGATVGAQHEQHFLYAVCEGQNAQYMCPSSVQGFSEVLCVGAGGCSLTILTVPEALSVTQAEKLIYQGVSGYPPPELGLRVRANPAHSEARCTHNQLRSKPVQRRLRMSESSSAGSSNKTKHVQRQRGAIV